MRECFQQERARVSLNLKLWIITGINAASLRSPQDHDIHSTSCCECLLLDHSRVFPGVALNWQFPGSCHIHLRLLFFPRGIPHLMSDQCKKKRLSHFVLIWDKPEEAQDAFSSPSGISSSLYCHYTEALPLPHSTFLSPSQVLFLHAPPAHNSVSWRIWA